MIAGSTASDEHVTPTRLRLLGRLPLPLKTEAQEQQGETSSGQAQLGVTSESPDFFSGLQWTPDGTSVLLNTSKGELHTVILPPDLLEASVNESPHELVSYARHELPEIPRATAIYPVFDLSRPETCLYLASQRDLPIRLISPFYPTSLATYPFVKASNEAWIAPHSLLFDCQNPNLFYAGTDNSIATFDLHRSGEGPISSINYGKRGRASQNSLKAMLASTLADSGMPFKGISSAMTINPDQMLAVGTFSGSIGLIDMKSHNQTIATIGSDHSSCHGITSLKFGPDPSLGQYLFSTSRMSDNVQVYDLRTTRKPICHLTGRNAFTQQRLGFDVDGFTKKVYAGSTDGVIRVWEDVTGQEGFLAPTKHIEADSEQVAISGVGVHPLGAGVLAACNGIRSFPDVRDNDNGKEDDGTGHPSRSSNSKLRVLDLTDLIQDRPSMKMT